MWELPLISASLLQNREIILEIQYWMKTKMLKDVKQKHFPVILRDHISRWNFLGLQEWGNGLGICYICPSKVPNDSVKLGLSRHLVPCADRKASQLPKADKDINFDSK